MTTTTMTTINAAEFSLSYSEGDSWVCSTHLPSDTPHPRPVPAEFARHPCDKCVAAHIQAQIRATGDYRWAITSEAIDAAGLSYLDLRRDG